MEIIVRFFGLLLSYLALLLNRILEYVIDRKQPDFPPIRHPLLLRPVLELVTALRRGQVIVDQTELCN